MPPQIEVTQQHIEGAIPKDSGHCMVADAIKAKIPKAQRVSVDLQTIRYTNPEKELRYTFFTPPIAQRALLDFDNGAELEPFSFRLGRSVLEHEAKRKVARTDGRRRIKHRKGQRSKVRGGAGIPRAQLSTPAVRTGLRREFGLRAMGR